MQPRLASGVPLQKLRSTGLGAAIDMKLRLAAVLLALCAAPHETRSEEPSAIALVAPGMNQTELQSVMGPPTYIQVKRRRQAWQYCPRRFFIRFLDEYVRRDDALFVTVWFNEGRVEHMRAYPGRVMGHCEDFLAAFSWEDVIESGGFVADGYGLK